MAQMPGTLVCHLFVDLDKSALADFDADFFQPQPFGIGTEADRHQRLFRFEHFGLAVSGYRDFDTRLRRFDRLDLVPGQSLDAALLEGLFQFGADLLILQRHDARQHLDDGHIHAVGIPDGGKLHADRARADDDHATWAVSPAKSLPGR